jgi:uncharacterized protein YjbJ (UPF0337 family)
MTRPDDEEPQDTPPPEAPATWENVVVGKAYEAVGHVLRDEKMVEDGEEQEEAAHEVREEYREERADPPDERA